MRKVFLLALAGSFVLAAGCASSMSGSAYERRQARTAHEVQMGVVAHIKVVEIEGTKSGVGAVAGAAAGSVIGGQAGNRGSVSGAIGSIAGAVVGGVAGSAAEEGITRQKGYEITVKLDGGRMIAVTQAIDEEFRVGERVRVLFGGRGDTRVEH